MNKRRYKVTQKFPSGPAHVAINLEAVDDQEPGGLIIPPSYGDWIGVDDELDIENLGRPGCIVYRPNGEVLYNFGTMG
jgi:hypothetical protein